MLRVGIAGSGAAAAGHVSAYRACPGVEVVALWSRTEARARELATEKEIPTVPSDVAGLLGENLDIISIATMPPLHYEIALAAIEEGVHPVCEKPMAMNAGEARQMREAADAQGLSTGLPFTWRYKPAAHYLKHMIDAGEIGDALRIESDWGAMLTRPLPQFPYLQAELGGGILTHIGSHDIDRVRWLLGTEAERVCGRVSRIHKDAVVDPEATRFVDALTWMGEHAGQSVEGYTNIGMTGDTAYDFMVDFPEDVLAVFRGGHMGTMGRRITVIGSQGTIVQDEDELSRSEFASADKEEVAIPDAFRDTAPADGWYGFAADFVAAVRGELTSVPTFYDGWRVREISDAVTQSHEDGKWVRIHNGDPVRST